MNQRQPQHHRHGGVVYVAVDAHYFERRMLRRHAGVAALWALGVGAVISGHFSGWNLGLAAGGWGGMFLATVAIAIMYLGLVFSLAELSPALPHTGAAYSFARSAMGPWGGFVTGLCENVEYVITPAVLASVDSCAIMLHAPRILNAPPGWKHSHFKCRRV